MAAAIDQIAQTTLRNVVGQHSLDEILSETSVINASIRQILDTTTLEWGVEVTLVELKDIRLPDTMKRAMAREAEAEREKRAKIIAAEGEARAAAALGEASDTMMAQVSRDQAHTIRRIRASLPPSPSGDLSNTHRGRRAAVSCSPPRSATDEHSGLED